MRKSSDWNFLYFLLRSWNYWVKSLDWSHVLLNSPFPPVYYLVKILRSWGAQNYHPSYFCHQWKFPSPIWYSVSHSHGSLRRVKVEFIKTIFPRIVTRLPVYLTPESLISTLFNNVGNSNSRHSKRHDLQIVW